MPKLYGTILHKQNEFRWKSPAVNVQLSRDGQTFSSVHWDGSIVRWSIATKSVLEIFRLPISEGSSILGAQFTNEEHNRAVIETETGCGFWNLQTKEKLAGLERYNSIPHLSLSPDRQIVFGRDFHFDIQTECFNRIDYPQSWRHTIAPNSKLVALWRSEHNRVKIVRIRDGYVCDEREFDEQINSAVFSSDGTQLFVATKLKVYAIDVTLTESFAVLRKERWNKPFATLGSLFFRCGELFAFSENKFWIINPQEGRKRQGFASPSPMVWQRSEVEVFIVGIGRPFSLGDFRGLHVEDSLAHEVCSATGITLSPSEKFVAWCNGSTAIVVECDIGTLRTTIELEDYGREAAFLSDEQHLCVGGRIYEWSSGCIVQELFNTNVESNGRLESFAVAPNGLQFVWCVHSGNDNTDKPLMIYSSELHRTTPLWAKDFHTTYLDLCFSADGTLICCSTADEVSFLDSRTGAIVEQGYWIRYAHSIHTDLFVIAKTEQTDDGEQQQFQVVSGREQQVVYSIPEKHANFCNIIHAFTERMILCWQKYACTATLLQDGEILATLNLDPYDCFDSAVFSKNERTLFVGTGKGEVYRFDIPQEHDITKA